MVRALLNSGSFDASPLIDLPIPGGLDMRTLGLTGASLSEHLSSLEPIDLRAAQISQLFADSRVNLLVSFSGGLLLAGLLWGAVSSYRLFIWLAVHWALLAIRYALAWRFRNRSPSREAVLRWGQWLRASATIAGLWWGLSGIFLFPTRFSSAPVYSSPGPGWGSPRTCANVLGCIRVQRFPQHIDTLASWRSVHLRGWANRLSSRIGVDGICCRSRNSGLPHEQGHCGIPRIVL